MAITRQRNQSGPAEPACDASDAAGQLDTGCKILPFRQKRLRESSRSGEFVHGCVVAEPDCEESLEARRNFLAVCLPECSETVYGDAWGRGEPTQNASFRAPRWLKRALLVSIFTAWTAAAISLAIALG